MHSSNESNLSEPDDAKRNSTGIKSGTMDVANISSIQQGSFDSSFDDDFVLRIKTPKMNESEGDTGVHTFSFDCTSDGKGLDGPDSPKLDQIGSVKLNAICGGDDNSFTVNILGYKVRYNIQQM